MELVYCMEVTVTDCTVSHSIGS